MMESFGKKKKKPKIQEADLKSSEGLKKLLGSQLKTGIKIEGDVETSHLGTSAEREEPIIVEQKPTEVVETQPAETIKEEKENWTEEDEKTLNELLAVAENANKTIENAKKRMAEINAEIERVKKEEEQAVISKPEEQPAPKTLKTKEQTGLENKEKEIKSYSVEFIKTKILPLLQNIKQIDEVKSLDIKGNDKEIILNTIIKSFGFSIAVQATLENKGDGIAVKNYKVDAKWFAKGKAQKAIEPHLNKISELLKSYIEKEENKKVEKIWIENGELKAL